MTRNQGTLSINGETVQATEFAYDGCHKIYLISSPEDRKTMEGCGYEASDIYPVSELPTVWQETCFLRFISSADLTRHYVEQGAESPRITYRAGVSR